MRTLVGIAHFSLAPTGDISAARLRRLRFSEKRATTLAYRPERLLARNDLEDLVVVPGIMRLLGLLNLDQVHVVHHPTVGAEEAAVREEIMNRHVAHLGDDGLGLVAAERVHSLKVMRHRGIDAGLRLGRHHAAPGECALTIADFPRCGPSK